MQAWEEKAIERKEAFDEGMESKLRELVKKKLERGKTISQIAEELEEEPQRIEAIIDSM